MVLISQDRLKAIPLSKIQFFVITPECNSDGDFQLLAKSPTAENNFYDYLILFKHKDIEIVKRVMQFLANGNFLTPFDDDKKGIIIADLPELYKRGMKFKD